MGLKYPPSIWGVTVNTINAHVEVASFLHCPGFKFNLGKHQMLVIRNLDFKDAATVSLMFFFMKYKAQRN